MVILQMSSNCFQGEEGIDVEYWENISKNLEMYKARVW